MDNAKLAAKWRKKNPEHCPGVVVIFNGQATGWMDKLRDPQGWEPGCIAIDVDGNEWVAVGGNVYDGAEKWEEVVK